MFFFKLSNDYVVVMSDLSFGLCNQKPAYGVRISDWSSDVCSSDLDVEKLLGGKNVISASYDVPMLAHGSPETPGATVRIAGDRCEIWAATQSATLVRDEVASAIGFPTEAVVVYPTLVGGGFGQIGRAHV